MTHPPVPPDDGARPAAPPPPAPRRRRPSGWWFALGGTLLVAALVTFVALFAWTLAGFLDTDATVRADGQPTTVRLEGDDRRMLWLDDDLDQSCDLVDPATGQPVATRPVSGSFTRADGAEEWTGLLTFAPGSGTVEVTCVGAGSVLVGPAPAIGSFVGGLLATILVPLFLGGCGLVVLIVTGVLFATGRPRQDPA